MHSNSHHFHYDAQSTIVQNIKSHFLRDPPVECKDQSAYDHFLEFITTAGSSSGVLWYSFLHTASTDTHCTDGGSASEGRGITGHEMLHRVIENVFHRSDVEGHSLTYMRKCVLRMVEWTCVVACSSAHGDQNGHDDQNDWGAYVKLLLKYVPGGETLGDDDAHTGLENVLQIQSMRSLAAVMLAVSREKSVGHVTPALRKILDSTMQSNAENDLILDIVFNQVIGTIDNGYVREAACELLASYCHYCSQSQTWDSAGLSQSIGQCFSQAFQSHCLQLLCFIMALVERTSRTDDPALDLRKLLSRLSILDTYVFSDRVFLIETDKAVMRKASEIIVKLSHIETSEFYPHFALQLSKILKNLLQIETLDSMNDHRIAQVEIALDMLGCCEPRKIVEALSVDSILSDIFNLLLRIMDICSSINEQYQLPDPKQSKLVISVLKALDNCCSIFKPLLQSDGGLFEKTVSLVLACLRGYEWFHNSSNNRRICISGLDLLYKLFAEQMALINLLSHESKTKFCEQLHGMCAYEASINHSIILLKASMILARLILSKEASSTLQKSVQRYWTSMLGGLLDMNWEVRDSTLQLISFLCREKMEYSSSLNRNDSTDIYAQLYPRQEFEKCETESQFMNMLVMLARIHENDDILNAQVQLNKLIQLVLQRLRDVDNYVKLTAIKTMDDMMLAGLLILSNEKDDAKNDNPSALYKCTVNLTDIVQQILAEDECGMMADFYVRRSLFGKMGSWLQRAQTYDLDTIVQLLSTHFSAIMNNCELEMYQSVLDLHLVLIQLHNTRPTDCIRMLVSLHMDDFICEVLETESNFSRETWHSMNTLSQWLTDNSSMFKQSQDAISRLQRISNTVKDTLARDASGPKAEDTSSGLPSFFTFEAANLDCY